MSTSYYVKISPAPEQSLTLRAPDGREATVADFWRIELLTPPCKGTPSACYQNGGQAAALREAQDCIAAWAAQGVEVELIQEGDAHV